MDSKMQVRGVQSHKTFSRHFLSLSQQGQQAGKRRSQPVVPHLDWPLTADTRHCRAPVLSLTPSLSSAATETKVPRFSKQKGWLMRAQDALLNWTLFREVVKQMSCWHGFKAHLFETQFFRISVDVYIYICKHNCISYLSQIYKTKIFMQSLQLVTKKTTNNFDIARTVYFCFKSIRSRRGACST